MNNSIRASVKRSRRSILIADIAMLLLGLLLILFPDRSAELICRVIGALLAVTGILRVVVYFAGEKTWAIGSFALVQGAAMVGFGALFFFRPESLVAFVMLALAISLIVTGVMKFQYAIDFARLKIRLWWIQLLGAAALIALGVVALLDPFAAEATLMIYIGISFVVGSLWDLISIFWLDRLIRTAEQAEKDAAIEASAVDAEYQNVE